MLISGTLGTMIGGFCSHNMSHDDAGASILLSPSWRCCSWQGAVGAASFAAVLSADRNYVLNPATDRSENSLSVRCAIFGSKLTEN
jgi:hypothetical protein